MKQLIVLDLRIEFQVEGIIAESLNEAPELWLGHSAQYAAEQAEKWFMPQHQARVLASAQIGWNPEDVT